MSAMAKSRLRLLALMLVFAVLLGSAQSLYAFASDTEYKSDSEASITIEEGELKIDAVPEIKFGRHDVNNRTTKFPAISSGDLLKVTDTTGTHDGWKVTVELHDFYNENERPGLSGASLIITPHNPEYAPEDPEWKTKSPAPAIPKDKVEVISGSNNSVIIMRAKATKNSEFIVGAGSWKMNYTNKDFTLFVPHASKDAGKYKAVMEWTLISDPTS